MIKTNNKNRVPLLQYPAAARFLMKGEYAFLDTHSCSLRAAVRALGSETALQPTSDLSALVLKGGRLHPSS
jgi:hypothetical protein